MFWVNKRCCLLHDLHNSIFIFHFISITCLIWGLGQVQVQAAVYFRVNNHHLSVRGWIKPVERPHLYSKTKTCVYLLVCAVRVIPYARLMLLSSLSYKCKWQLAPFSPTHSWRGILTHRSSPPFTSFANPTHTHPNTHTLHWHCRSASGSNDEQLTGTESFHLFPSRCRRASFSQRKATTLSWFIYLFSPCSSSVSYFPVFMCVC